MLAEHNHGLPSREGMPLGASSAMTTTEILNRWPPMMTNILRKSLRGLTDRVFVIRSQKGQFSHEIMSKLLHVALLMMFNPDPPSTTHPVISVPCTKTLLAGF